MVIIYFDGHCNLCNRFIDFLIRHDHSRKLRYAPLQGKTAARELPSAAVSELSTMALTENGRVVFESTAALRAVAHLGGIYSFAKLLLVLPRFLRDAIYRFVAQRRYSLFGRRDTCRLPTPAEKALFLD